jgi:hypothetical protein
MCRKIVCQETLTIVVFALSSFFLLNPHPKTDAQCTTACFGTNTRTMLRGFASTNCSLADGFNPALLLVSDWGSPLSFNVTGTEGGFGLCDFRKRLSTVQS